jgi:hypothetical protein
VKTPTRLALVLFFVSSTAQERFVPWVVTIDDRLLLMIPAFKTAADRQDHSRDSDD